METQLVVPPLTPFTGTGAIDWPALRAQIDYKVHVADRHLRRIGAPV